MAPASRCCSWYAALLQPQRREQADVHPAEVTAASAHNFFNIETACASCRINSDRAFVAMATVSAERARAKPFCKPPAPIRTGDAASAAV